MVRGSRRRGRLLVLPILAALLIVGFVGVDAWVREQAEQRLAAAVLERLGADQASVSIASWPFLTAMPADRLERVHLVVADVPVDVAGRSGVVNQVTATALGIQRFRDPAQARAERVTGIVRMDWTQVAAVTGLALRPAGKGRVALDQTVKVLDASLPVVLEATVGVAPDGTLTLRDATLSGAGLEVSAELVDRLLAGLAAQMRLPTAAGLVYTGLESTEDGLRAELSGSDVRLSELG